MANFYEEILNAQKNMMDNWKNIFNPMTANENSEGGGFVNYFENMAKLNSQMVKQFYDAPKEFMNSAKGFFPYANNLMSNAFKITDSVFLNPTDLFEKLSNNYSSYFSAYNLYKNLINEKGLNYTAINENFEKINREYVNYVKKFFLSFNDNLNMDLYDNLYGAYENMSKTLQNAINPWFASFDYEGYLNAIKKGPEGYIKFMEHYEDNFLESLKAFENSPYKNYYKFYVELQKKAYMNVKNYNELVANYYQKIYDIYKEATTNAIKEYKANLDEGLAKDNFEDFYEFLNSKTKQYLEKALRGEEYSKLLESTFNAFNEFKNNSNQLKKEYFKSNDDSEIDRLKKEIEDLKSQVKKLSK